MGKTAVRLLRFAIAYAGWHTYGKDRSTVSALYQLEQRGLIVVDRENRRWTLALGPSWHSWFKAPSMYAPDFLETFKGEG